MASIGIRPYVVYGPGRDQGMTSGPTLAMAAAARDESYEIGYGGTVQYDFAPDVGRAFALAARAATESAHVANFPGEPSAMADVVAAIEQAAPAAAGKITWKDERLPFPDSLEAVAPGTPTRPASAHITRRRREQDDRPLSQPLAIHAGQVRRGWTTVLVWNRKIEPPTESCHVVKRRPMRLVAEVTKQLNLGCQTPHLPIAYTPDAGESGRRVDPVLVVLHQVDPVAGLREDNRVHVDLPTLGVDQLEALRRTAADTDVPAPGESVLQRRNARQGNDEIEVVVRTSLRSECCVHSPAPVEPHVDSTSFETRNELDHHLRAHLETRLTPGSRQRPHRTIVAHEVVVQWSSGRSVSRAMRKPRLTSSSVPSNVRSSCSIETT